MMNPHALSVFLALWVCLGLGMIGATIVSLKSKDTTLSATLWRKLAWYVVIVHVVALSIATRAHDLWPALAGMIALAGLGELARLIYASPRTDAVAAARGLLLYAALAGGFLHFALRTPAGHQLFVYAVVCVFDGFSQVMGQWFGRRKLAPVVSPAKTIEGAFGGAVAAVTTAIGLAAVAGLSRPAALSAGLAICAAALGGDLTASMCKRRYGAKDFGALLPAQGGVLDRFDSFIAAGFAWSVGQALFALPGSAVAAVGVSLALALVFAAAQYAYRRRWADAEVTRKCVHVGAGLIAAALPALNVPAWYVVALGAGFFVLMRRTACRNTLACIHAVGRPDSLGSHSFPLALCACYLAYLWHGRPAWYLVPVLILTVSDPLAALVGRHWPLGRYRWAGATKTLAGSAAFFVSALIVALWALSATESGASEPWRRYATGLLVAAVATAAEAATRRGLDNLTVPASAFAVLALLG